MPYYISYKGKKLGSPLTKNEAEEKLVVLSRCFKQLEIVKENSQPVGMLSVTLPIAESN
ncbi:MULTISPECIES: hypothetical protein [Paenibacillus]|jgi:hypothetical protein|uniref:Uncharacterized protein n=1 Tax=Paenibacillus oceani TaxID=2772510 RepID=A0A927GZM2_9BACL|nr:hypothetical protein [Paenibacillus oceani]MBD2863146.1 hypothetical protein [Paenibacillus oceani]MDF2662251.1 hypothetical protein [Paenibacillus sp.]